MTVNYSAILDHMVATAREAGALTLDHFRRFREIEIGVKGPGDFVSDADRDSETLIRDRLLGQYPWGLTGEEFAPVEGADRDHRWLVAFPGVGAIIGAPIYIVGLFQANIYAAFAIMLLGSCLLFMVMGPAITAVHGPARSRSGSAAAVPQRMT